MGVSEKELLKKIRQDGNAFTILYDQYYAAIFGYVFRRTGDYDLSCDITAETFLKAYQKIGFFEWRGRSLGSWFYKIAGNEVNQFYRNSKYKPVCLHDLQWRERLEYDPGIETEKAALQKELEENRVFQAVLNKLKELDIRYQEVIALRFFEHKNIRDISQILGKKEGTVKSLLSRGIKQLKAGIEEESLVNHGFFSRADEGR